jgi:hypothetical protein
LPQAVQGREVLLGRDRCLVRFYTHNAYVEEIVQQHNDWYLGGKLVGCEPRTIARGNNSYLV